MNLHKCKKVKKNLELQNFFYSHYNVAKIHFYKIPVLCVFTGNCSWNIRDTALMVKTKAVASEKLCTTVDCLLLCEVRSNTAMQV